MDLYNAAIEQRHALSGYERLVPYPILNPASCLYYSHEQQILRNTPVASEDRRFPGPKTCRADTGGDAA